MRNDKTENTFLSFLMRSFDIPLVVLVSEGMANKTLFRNNSDSEEVIDECSSYTSDGRTNITYTIYH